MKKPFNPIQLSTTYDAHDPRLLETVLPHVHYLEVTPDTITRKVGDKIVYHEGILSDLKAVSKDVEILVHGVGLSIGSYDGFSMEYIRLLDILFNEIPVAWHSEHLGYTQVDGIQLNTMLAMPRTNETLDMLCERIEFIRNRYHVPFALENIIRILPDDENPYSDAEFLNLLARNSGCKLILDTYNLECDVKNHGLDADAFLKELDMTAVQEIHVAGGIEYNGFQLDIHSDTVSDETIALTQKALLNQQNQIKALTYELLPQAVPVLGYAKIEAELRRLSQIFSLKPQKRSHATC
jgi:uncharacterized protein